MEQQQPTTPVKVTLADGKERVLRFNYAALKTMAEKYDISIMRDGVGKLFGTLDETRFAEILVLGLDHKAGQPGITVADLDDLLDAQNSAVAAQQVVLALGSSVLKNALDVVKGWMETERLKKEKALLPKTPEPEPANPIPPAVN